MDNAATEEQNMKEQRRDPDMAWEKEGSNQDARELNPKEQIVYSSMMG